MGRDGFSYGKLARRRARFDVALLGSALCLCAVPAQAQTQNNPNFRVPGMIIIWGTDSFGSSATSPVVSDFIIDSGTGTTAASSGDADLIAGDVHTVVTGTLTPTISASVSRNGAPIRVQRVAAGGGINTDSDGDGVLTAADGFSAFGLQANTDTNTRRAEIESSFYVASNVPFSIDATATTLGATNAAAFNQMRVRMRVTQSGNDGLAFGSAAQFPHSGGAAGGIRANFRRLSTMTTPFPVFTGNQRTARTPGTIAEQSVRFDLTYRFNSGNTDLSDGVIDAAAEVIYTAYIP